MAAIGSVVATTITEPTGMASSRRRVRNAGRGHFSPRKSSSAAGEDADFGREVSVTP